MNSEEKIRPLLYQLLQAYDYTKNRVMDTDIMQQHIDLIVKNSTVDIIFALKQKTQCQHNWLIKDEHSGWLSRPGGRELKTVFCTKCLAETNI